MKSRKVLILFAHIFPFGLEEAYIEKEIPYLSKAFDKIIIVSNNCTNPRVRNLPGNIIAERSSYELGKKDRLLSLLGLLSPTFWSEFFTILLKYHLIPRIIILNTALLSLRKSRVFGSRISHILSLHTKPTDQVFLYSFWTDDNAFAISQYRKSPNIRKVLSRAHRWDVYFEENKSKYLPYRKSIFRKMDAVYFSTNHGLNYYKNIFPKLHSKMQLALLGVHAQPSFPSKPDDKVLRIVSCSYIIPIKRIPLIVGALELIQDIHVEWIHFGDGTMRNEIAMLCKKKLDPKSNITYTLHGGIKNPELIHFYTTHFTDLFINVSHSEGIAVSIMEALSFGIPCIATAVGGTTEVINNENGFLLSSNPSCLEISEKISAYYHLGEAKKREKRSSALKMWAEKCDAEKNYMEFMDELLSATTPPATDITILHAPS